MRLRILSYNIQVGIGSIRRRHLITHGWRYVFPHAQTLANLENIAAILRNFDIVGLQEADAGSFRTRHINQARYLAMRAHFPYWHCQITREMGNIARMSCSLLARIPWFSLRQHRLPASRHGRVALEACFSWEGIELAVFITHLSLRKQSRLQQMRFLASRIRKHSHAVLLGDLNCQPSSEEFRFLIRHTGLQIAKQVPMTFPSWRPVRCFDHILCSRSLRIERLHAIDLRCSDHLPVAAEIRLKDSQGKMKSPGRKPGLVSDAL